jgi:hypothetical protein
MMSKRETVTSTPSVQRRGAVVDAAMIQRGKELPGIASRLNSLGSAALNARPSSGVSLAALAAEAHAIGDALSDLPELEDAAAAGA